MYVINTCYIIIFVDSLSFVCIKCFLYSCIFLHITHAFQVANAIEKERTFVQDSKLGHISEKKKRRSQCNGPIEIQSPKEGPHSSIPKEDPESLESCRVILHTKMKRIPRIKFPQRHPKPSGFYSFYLCVYCKLYYAVCILVFVN